VKDEDEVKGYQRGEDEYVMLEDEELENVALFFCHLLLIVRIP
jgi:DNA end-binding protein Ku